MTISLSGDSRARGNDGRWPWQALGADGYPRPLVVPILNATPDSFSDGGQLLEGDALLAQVQAWVDAGVCWVDVGGESTQPGAQAVPMDEELARVIPVIKTLHKAFPDLWISIDTRKAAVADAALQAGARIVNDVSGLTFDPDMAKTVARHRASVVIMHSQGTPETMQDNPQYGEVVSDVRGWLQQQVQVALAAGVPRGAICLDPGFGFGKTQAHNEALLAGLDQLSLLGYPLFVGLSRKSFLPGLFGLPTNTPPRDRDALSLRAMALAYAKGARVFRVHGELVAAVLEGF